MKNLMSLEKSHLDILRLVDPRVALQLLQRIRGPQGKKSPCGTSMFKLL